MYERVLTARLAGGARRVPPPAPFRDYLTEPQRFGRELESAKRATRLILVDEIQRAPSLLDTIQVALDRDAPRFRFLVSGSSARQLRRGGANLLPGRRH